jgi:hypothetical protein
MTNWIELWQGNRSEWLVDHTMVPSVSMWTDRRLMSGAPDVPGAITVPVEVTDSESMMDWMTSVGTNYTYLYHFNFTDPTGRMLVARWTLFGETGKRSECRRPAFNILSLRLHPQGLNLHRYIANRAMTDLSFLSADTPIGARGEPISMNGTDIFEFDECSGRISQVMTAQDILHFAYQKGINIFTKK